MYMHIDGRLYAFAYLNGPLIECDQLGNAIRIVFDAGEAQDIRLGMMIGESDAEGGEHE